MSTQRVWNPGDPKVLPPADESGYGPDSVDLGEPEFETECDRQVWIAQGGQKQGDEWSAFSPD